MGYFQLMVCVLDSYLKGPRSIPIVVIHNKGNKCQDNDQKSPEDGSRTSSRNVIYIKHISGNGQFPTVYL